MSGPSTDFALLLEAPHPVQAELARGLLEEAGIPILLHGPNGDLAELGAFVPRPHLYVPKAELERARTLLAEAFGPPESPEPR